MNTLKSFQLLYHSIVSTKNFLYDYGFLKPISLNVPVISIGNLSVGGTGKTPCVAMIANELSHSKKVIIIAKSYKASLKVPQRVDLSDPFAWKRFGDEACLLQRLLPQCIVWAGPSKSKTAMAAVVDKPDVILVDDGFSHRRLKRDLDIVLIDATRELEHMQVLPSGRLREDMSNLRRAQIVLLTKTNLTSSEQVERMSQFLVKEVPTLKENLFYATSENILNLPLTNKILVFCGLGSPKSFLMALKKMEFEVIDSLEFQDHHNYSLTDQKKILESYQNLKKLHQDIAIVTTPKDALKISLPELKSLIQVTENKMKLAVQKENFFEKIGKIF